MRTEIRVYLPAQESRDHVAHVAIETKTDWDKHGRALASRENEASAAPQTHE